MGGAVSAHRDDPLATRRERVPHRVPGFFGAFRSQHPKRGKLLGLRAQAPQNDAARPPPAAGFTRTTISLTVPPAGASFPPPCRGGRAPRSSASPTTLPRAAAAGGAPARGRGRDAAATSRGAPGAAGGPRGGRTPEAQMPDQLRATNVETVREREQLERFGGRRRRKRERPEAPHHASRDRRRRTERLHRRARALGVAPPGQGDVVFDPGAASAWRSPGSSRIAALTTFSAVARNVVSFPPAVERSPSSTHTASSREASDGVAARLESTGRTPANAPVTLRSVKPAEGKECRAARSRYSTSSALGDGLSRGPSWKRSVVPNSVPSGWGTANAGRASSGDRTVTARSMGSAARANNRCEPREGRRRALAGPPSREPRPSTPRSH